MTTSISHADAPRLKFARAIVFCASFCLMTIEIVASRVVAPYLGVSLYTWTSVIAVVLLGVTVGNYAGGLYADRRLTRHALGLILAFGGISALAMNALAPFLGPWLGASRLPLPVSVFVFSFVEFFPAAFFLSTISPQVVKFDLHDLERTGTTIGSIGAWSAAGSIAGTFATGFIFIMYFGTKSLILGLSAFLILLGIAIAWQDKIWRHRATPVVALLFLGEMLLPGMCHQETNYYCIRRITEVREDGTVSYRLLLDHLVHSFTTPSAPDEFGYDYEHIQAALVAYRMPPDAKFSTLTIGGGGYTMPRYLEALYPNAQVDVVEIDPGVTEFNHARMELPRTTRIRTMNQDARLFLQNLPVDAAYDYIFEDAVNDFAVPFQLTTKEFHALVRRHLSPDGFYSLTIIDAASRARFTAALVRAIQASFPHVYVFPLGSDLVKGEGQRNTFEIVASIRPLDDAKWSQTRPLLRPETEPVAADQWARATHYLSAPELDTFLSHHPEPGFTDDFAPTDNYLAPVFRDAYGIY